MAGSAAAKNGVYDYQDEMTLQSFIDLAGGSVCAASNRISVKRVLEDDFFAIGQMPLDGKIVAGDTVYFNCIE